MEPDAKWPVGVIVLCLVAILRASLVEIKRNKGLAAVDQLTVGWEMRSWFHILLATSVGLRIVCLILEVLLPGNALEDKDTAECWVVGLSHGVPDVLFLATFSLLTLQFSQLYYVFEGSRYSSLRRVYVGYNCTVLGTFILLPMTTGSCVTFRVRTFLLLGLAYSIGALGMMYYGLRFAYELWVAANTLESAAQRGEVEDDDGIDFYQEQQAALRRRLVLQRVLFLCISCTIVFVLRAGYGFAAGSTLSGTLGYPPGVEDRFAFDSIGYLIAEVVPSIIALMLTSPKGDDGYNEPIQADSDVYPEAVVGLDSPGYQEPLLQSYQQAILEEGNTATE